MIKILLASLLIAGPACAQNKSVQEILNEAFVDSTGQLGATTSMSVQEVYNAIFDDTNNALSMTIVGEFLISTVNVSGFMTVAGSVTAASFHGDGSGLTGVPVTGSAGGDLTGTYPNPTLAVNRVILSGDEMTGGLGITGKESDDFNLKVSSPDATAQLAVTRAGFVGINDDTPSDELDIFEPDGGFDATISLGGRDALERSGSVIIVGEDSGHTRVQFGPNPRNMSFNVTSGNAGLGIGTDNPDGKLDILATENDAFLLKISSQDATARFVVKGDEDATYITDRLHVGFSDTESGFDFDVVGLVRQRADPTVGLHAISQLFKTDATIGTGELLTAIAFGATPDLDSGTDIGAAIQGVMDGTYTAGSAIPMEIRFQTAPTGSTSLTTRMNIGQDGLSVGKGNTDAASGVILHLGSGLLRQDDLAASYTGGSAYACIDDDGDIFASEAACP